MLRQTRILLWRAVAIIALALGAIGVVLPLLPTVPFLLLAAWAASRGWPRFETWLLQHPAFGPPIRQWRARGAISRRSKYWAISLLSVSAAVILLLELAAWIKGAVLLILVATAVWLWRRPEQ